MEQKFYWQLQKAEKSKNFFLIQQAKLNKELYLISKDLSIEDWRIIRSGDYYEKRDKLSGLDQIKFIIEKVKYYI